MTTKLALLSGFASCVQTFAQCGLEPGGLVFQGIGDLRVPPVFRSAVWDPDGTGPQPPRLALRGGFTAVDGMRADGFIEWDGQQWRALPVPAHGAWALLGGAGQLLGGGGAPATIEAWNGQTWSPIASGPDGTVAALERFAGELYAAGSFTSFGGATGRVVRLGASGWSAVPGAFPGPIVPGRMAAAGGRLVIQGQQSQDETDIWDGSTLQRFLSPSMGAWCMAAHGQDVFRGNFIFNFGALVQRWDGSAWVAHGDNLGPSFQQAVVVTLGSYNGELYAGGDFVVSTGTGAASGGVARFRNGAWEAVGAGFAAHLVEYGNELIAVGTYAPPAQGNMLAWNGTSWRSLTAPRPSISGSIYDLERVGDQLWACGPFNMRDSAGAEGGGVARRVNGNWIVEPEVPVGFIPRVVVGVSGEMYVFGDAYMPVPVVYRRTAQGWSPVGEISAAGGSQFSAVNWAGSLVVGGRVMLGSETHRVARWDGQAWSALPSPPGETWDLAVIGGQLYAAGYLSGPGSPGYVARYDGSQWTTLGGPFSSRVETLGRYETAAGVHIIAAGPFTSVGGMPANRVARWDGQAWHAMGGGPVNPNGASLQVRIEGMTQSGSTLVAAGAKSTGSDWELAVFTWDGMRWTEWAGSDEGYIHDVVEAPAGDGFWLAGDLAFVNGQISPGIARLPSVPCYGNCDCSNSPPVLNVADFTCFLQRFAAGDAYANCDASTTLPTLNVADFTCFLQRFAAGCP